MNTPVFVKFLKEYLFRSETYVPVHPAPVSLQSTSNSQEEVPYLQYISDLETINDSLSARLEQLEEENKSLRADCQRKADRIHDMEIMVSVFEKMVPQINIFHADKAEQINGVIESGAKVSHTKKTNDYDTE